MSHVLGLAYHHGGRDGYMELKKKSSNRICRVLLTIELDHSATPCCFFCDTDIPFYNTLHALCNKYNRRAAYWQRGRETKRFNSVTLEHCHQMGDGEEEGQQQRCNSSSTEILWVMPACYSVVVQGGSGGMCVRGPLERKRKPSGKDQCLTELFY